MHSSGKQLDRNPCAVLLLFVLVGSVAGDGNDTSGSSLSRSKRFAIFNGQGTNKIVIGLAFPVKQEDTVRSVVGFINYQAQYVPSPIPIYWWSFWNTSTFVTTARKWRQNIQSRVFQDKTRIWLYDVVETGLERLGDRNAGACLLRSICEISQRPLMHSNIFSELINAVLVPSLDNVPEKYLHARNAGKAGANCWKTYSECSKKFWKSLIQMAKISF
ncbi:uncharacterized protein LOC128253854 [Drosophila gunungcola]|uniref:Uncharacterized protein n=1 Tax=Drosophila gunungcola TaxID=103775 RepID=A0A9P9YWQ0_9MUSC|nr:uncharacterized protein LOC128253854 [Drosophila gunungcola]KAI8044069.1 hypothetical protein M5D96_000219 [Drosophila gunungcola]